MIKKVLFVFGCITTTFCFPLFAQQNSKVDSLIRRQNNIFINKDTVTVPALIENPLLLSQNYLYKLRLDSITKTISLPYNEYVQHYIDIYAKRKDMIGQMLGLSSYYFPIFEKALKEYNIPQEIKYLPIIESSMNPHAVSRVGATGLWQFMFGTGKGYGLKMDNFVDERKDPIQASYAAAAYFRDAYRELGDWLLAVAAYNCGMGNVNRAIGKAGSRDFWEIRPFLPLETRNYVPALIATIYIMNYSGKHQINAKVSTLYPKTDTVLVSRFVSLPLLAKALNVDENSLTDLNPSYKKKIVNGSVELPKRIIMPKLKGLDFASIYEVLNDTVLDLDIQIIQASTDDVRELRKRKSSDVASARTIINHKVKPKQTLFQVAKMYNIEVQDLKVWNRLKSQNIVPGQLLKIFVKAKIIAKPSSYITYKVKAGDTLTIIAKKFEGVSAQSLQRENNLKKTDLQPGMILRISKG